MPNRRCWEKRPGKMPVGKQKAATRSNKWKTLSYQGSEGGSNHKGGNETERTVVRCNIVRKVSKKAQQPELLVSWYSLPAHCELPRNIGWTNEHTRELLWEGTIERRANYRLGETKMRCDLLGAENLLYKTSCGEVQSTDVLYISFFLKATILV